MKSTIEYRITKDDRVMPEYGTFYLVDAQRGAPHGWKEAHKLVGVLSRKHPQHSWDLTARVVGGAR